MKEIKMLLKEYEQVQESLFYANMQDYMNARQKELYELLEVREIYLRIILRRKFVEKGLIYYDKKN